MLFATSQFFSLIYEFFSKKGRLIGLITLLCLGYLAGDADPQTTSDYTMYSTIYKQSGVSTVNYFEKGYSEMARFFLSHNFDYAQFRLVFAILAAIILYLGVSKFTKNVPLFSVLYGCTVFCADATQIRNFMMISIVVFAYSFLIKASFKNYIIAIALVLVAAQFHSTGYFFLIGILLNLFPTYDGRFTGFILLPVEILTSLFIALFGTSSVTSFLSGIAGLIGGRDTLSSKLTQQYNYGTQTEIVIAMGLLITLAVVFEAVLLDKDDFKERVLFNGMLVGLFSIPTLELALDYSRISRNAFLFAFIAIAYYFEKHQFSKLDDKRKLSMIGLLIVCVGVGFVYLHFLGSEFTQSIPYLLKLINVTQSH